MLATKYAQQYKKLSKRKPHRRSASFDSNPQKSDSNRKEYRTSMSADQVETVKDIFKKAVNNPLAEQGRTSFVEILGVSPSITEQPSTITRVKTRERTIKSKKDQAKADYIKAVIIVNKARSEAERKKMCCSGLMGRKPITLDEVTNEAVKIYNNVRPFLKTPESERLQVVTRKDDLIVVRIITDKMKQYRIDSAQSQHDQKEKEAYENDYIDVEPENNMQTRDQPTWDRWGEDPNTASDFDCGTIGDVKMDQAYT